MGTLEILGQCGLVNGWKEGETSVMDSLFV